MDVQEKALVFINSHPPEREVEFSSNDVEAPLVQKKYFRRFSKMAAFGNLNSIYCSGMAWIMTVTKIMRIRRIRKAQMINVNTYSRIF